jgi:prevent-host-death family protein
MKVNVHHAKTNLSKLILRAEAGEEVVIARDGKPVIKLVPVQSSSPKIFKPGAFKSRLRVPSDFLVPDQKIELLFAHPPLVASGPKKPAALRKKRKA